MNMEDFDGKVMMLQGVELTTESYGCAGGTYGVSQSEVIYFKADDVVYTCFIDPDDGYRSYLSDIVVSDSIDRKCTFPPQEVRIECEEEMLTFIDTTNDKVVLEIGTDAYDEWYPIGIIKWSPENLACNNA